MQAKLRQVGNSVGMTIPASELKRLSVGPGDTVELQITKVVRGVRQGWENPQAWSGADAEPLHLDAVENDFDAEDWQW